MAKDPLLWLTMRDRWLPRLVWGACAVGVTVVAWSVVRQNILNPSPGRGQFQNYLSSTITGLLSLAMYLWMASMACRLFIDAARNGAMELILVTPVGPGQIVRNQWAAIWRTFLVPLLLVLALEIASHLLNLMEMRRMMAATKAPANTMPGQTFQDFALAIGIVNFTGSLAAIAWFGMWMGLRSRKTPVAVLKTLAFVLVLPWFAMVFVQIAFTMAMAFSARSGGTATFMPVYLGQAASSLVDLGKNIFFIVWSRKKLLTEFREAVEQGGQPPAKPAPPLIPPLPPAVVSQ